MPCTQCNGKGEDNRSYDRVHEQKELSMGAWRWASRCPTCGTMIYEPAQSLTAATPKYANTMSVFSPMT